MPKIDVLREGVAHCPLGQRAGLIQLYLGSSLFLAVPGERTLLLSPGNDHRLLCARSLTGVISFSPRKVHFTVEDIEAWRIKTLVQG